MRRLRLLSCVALLVASACAGTPSTAAPPASTGPTVAPTASAASAPPSASAQATAVTDLAAELTIVSTIEIRKINGFTAQDGKATVSGRIRLAGDPTTGHWHGTGSLLSSTTSTPGDCGTIYIHGAGTYDWVVNDVVVKPGIAATDIVADMDAGPIVELDSPTNKGPDKFVVHICRAGTLTGELNTWENLFMVLHLMDYKARGLHVGQWTLAAGGGTWVDRRPIATAKWESSCIANAQLAVIAFCHETTSFTLYAVRP